MKFLRIYFKTNRIRVSKVKVFISHKFYGEINFSKIYSRLQNCYIYYIFKKKKKIFINTASEI